MASTAEDARSRTKIYLGAYLNSSYITIDDDTTYARFIIAFGLPDYSIERVFLGFKDVDVVFSVGKPEAVRILFDCDQVPIGYVEEIPITIYSVDKTGSTANKTLWKAERDFRRVLETYPTGSQRYLSAGEELTEVLGSTTLYATRYRMTYERDTT